ncbi:MAG: hypothetical protein KDI11_05665 [Alphaproteobacteria bacterium]|nr:hypothetical protein [Alphaproteobacteria bacterium]
MEAIADNTPVQGKTMAERVAEKDPSGRTAAEIQADAAMQLEIINKQFGGDIEPYKAKINALSNDPRYANMAFDEFLTKMRDGTLLEASDPAPDAEPVETAPAQPESKGPSADGGGGAQSAAPSAEPAKPASEPLVIHITDGMEMKLSGRMAMEGHGKEVVEIKHGIINPNEQVRDMQKALVAAGFDVGTYPEGHAKAGQPMTDGLEGELTRGAERKAAEAMGLTEDQLRTMPIEEFTQRLEEYKLKMEQKHGVVVPDSKPEGTQVSDAETPLACPVEEGRSPFALDQILKQSPVGEIRELGQGTPQMCFTEDGQNMLIGGNPASENFQNFAVAHPAVVEPPQSSPEPKPDQEAPVVQNDTVTLRLA